jgi:hypothetical protein
MHRYMTAAMSLVVVSALLGCAQRRDTIELPRLVYDRQRGDVYVSQTADVAHIAWEFQQQHNLNWSHHPHQIHQVAQYEYIVIFQPGSDGAVRALHVCIGGDHPRGAHAVDATDLARLRV